MEIDALPDELLLQIFALVADADTLLDGVARTCKRWLRVSRDPAAWANVRVEVRSARPLPPHMPSSQWRVRASAVGEPDLDLNRIGVSAPQGAKSPPSAGLRAAARALLRAPALRAVVLDWVTLSDRERALVTSALRRCSAAEVREVRLVGSTLGALFRERLHGDGAPLGAVARLLWRHRARLRALDTMLIPILDLGDGGKMMPFFTLLADMQHLEELRLRVHGRLLAATRGYGGQLRDRLTRLRVLAVKAHAEGGLDLDEHGAALTVDLLRGAAASLRTVDVKSFFLPGGDAALERCTGLRELHCNAVRVPALHGMTGLRVLDLRLRYGDLLTAPLTLLPGCQRAVEADCGDALAGVRLLELHADVDPDSDEFDHMPPACELYAAVARGACHAEEVRLRLNGFYYCPDAEFEPDVRCDNGLYVGTIGTLLTPACLPRVRRLCISETCLPADLDRIAALPDSLAEVVVEMSCDSWRGHLMTACKEGVARLRERRPELKTNIRIRTREQYGKFPPLF